MSTLLRIPVEPVRPLDLDDDARNEVLSAVFEVLTSWLTERLTREPEAATLEAMDTACTLDPRPDELADDWLTVAVAEDWYPGAVAAIHWYTIAARSARDALTAVLEPVGLRLGPPPEEEDRLPLVPVGEDLVVVHRGGEISSTEGIELHPTPQEIAAIAEAARTGQCACQLCEPKAAGSS